MRPVCYTRNNGKVYATLLGWNGGAITLKALAQRRARRSGRCPRSNCSARRRAFNISQSDQGLTVTPGGTIAAADGDLQPALAAGTRVLRITHDKGWFNDDDPGAAAPGWMRRAISAPATTTMT